MILIAIAILLFSAIIHEYMHAWMANELGDSTAKDMGRLTLNPLKHIDPVMTVLVPLIFYLSFGFVFGGAKPVPINPANMKDSRYGSAKAAAAGPLGNLVVALFFGVILRFYPVAENIVFAQALAMIVQLNLLLMVFNLVPLPPLDGSKILMPFLPYRWQAKYAELERYGLMLVVLFAFFGFSIVLTIIDFLYKLIVGY